MTQKANIRNSKVSAFTVIDMITGMVIMSIIMSFVFFIFSSFTKQISDYSKSRSNLVALNLLNIQLRQDIIRADEIIQIPQGFSILNERVEISYKLIDNRIIKSNRFLIDTVYNHVSELKCELHNNINQYKLNERINKILIVLHSGLKKMNLVFYKDYSNQELINSTILNEAE